MSTIDKLEELANGVSTANVLYQVVQYTDYSKYTLGLARYVRYGVYRITHGIIEPVGYFRGSKSVREYFLALEKNLQFA